MSTIVKRKNRYDCGAVEDGIAKGLKLRMVHRKSLTGIYADTHPKRAGRGKYINTDAYPGGDPSKRRIQGAQHVNPYLSQEGCCATIIETFKSQIPVIKMNALRGRILQTRMKGEHIVWDGRRNSDECLVSCPPMTAQEWWKLAQELNPKLRWLLRSRKSGRKNVIHKTAFEKFLYNINVMRRATCTVDIVTGQEVAPSNEYLGGKTPYAMPLEQVGFAIDRRYLTYDVVNGDEKAQYYYNLVIGRSAPHDLPQTSWWYESSDSDVAFLNSQVQRKSQAIERKIGKIT